MKNLGIMQIKVKINMTEKLKATGEQILILPDAPLDRTPGGLIIPVDARDKRNSGVVVDGELFYLRANAEDPLDNISILPGDRVAFNYRAGYEVEYEGVVYLSIRKEFIAMKLNLNNNMQPLTDRVLILPKKAEQTASEGGIILLEDKILLEGTVVAAGPGKIGEPMALIAGDVVIWKKQNTGVSFEGYVILHQSDVEMVVGGFEAVEPLGEENID